MAGQNRVEFSEPGTRAQPLAGAALVASLLLLAVVYFAGLSSLPHKSWNNARLAPSVALTYGYSLYSGPDTGPLEPTLYGPVKALLLLPAALASSPTGAVLIGGSINLVMFLLPLLVLLWSGGGMARPSISNTAVGFGFAASCAQLLPSLRYMSTNIHVDAPAVGLGLLSCVVLMTGRGAPRLGRLALAATLVVLAAWSKQIEAPLAIAQLAWLWIAFGRRTATLFACCLAGVGAAVGALFFAAFGFSEMMFNIFTLVAVHPLDGGLGWVLLSAVDFLINCSPFLFIILLAFRKLSKQKSLADASGEDQRSFSGLGLRNLRLWPWSLLLFAAVLLAPASILARAFAGGDQNSFHSHYYLLAAAALILTQLAGQEGAGKALVYRRVLVALVAVLTVTVAYKSGPPTRLLHPFDNPLERALRFARQHPGEVYLPWHPLVSLFADGRLYHFDYAIYDHEIAGHSISHERFLAHIPPGLRYVVVPEMSITSSWQRFLPEFSERVDIAELEGWMVLTRE